MTEPVAAIIRSETRISILINIALSAAFFFAVFGMSPRSLTFAAPDNLALDFLPQSIAIGFFAALVPALLVSNKRRKGLISEIDANADPAKTVGLRALVFAVICGLIGALIAGALPLVTPHCPYFPALGIKMIYGGLLAAIVTPRALRLALSNGNT